MKKITAVLMMFLLAALLVSCSFGSTSSSSVSDKPKVINQKAKTDKANEDFSNKLVTTKTNYLTLRSQNEDTRLSKRNVELDSAEASRVNEETTLIKQYSDEIEARHTANLNAIEEKYASAKSSIAVSGQTSTAKASDLSNASLQYSQAQYTENNNYINNKVTLDKLKRQYETKIAQAKSTRDNNEDTFKRQCTSKYDDQIEKISSTNTGSGSDWDRLINSEQKELTDYYAEQDKKYNDGIKDIYSWLQDTLGSTFK